MADEDLRERIRHLMKQEPSFTGDRIGKRVGCATSTAYAEARARVAENAAEVERTKTKKARAKLERVANGICPECNRGFKNLERHMHTKHAAPPGGA